MKTQTIFEVLKQSVNLTWVSKGEEYGECYLMVGDKKLVISFYGEENNIWEVMFGFKSMEAGRFGINYDVTGEGNQYLIFSGVRKAMEEFLLPKNPSNIMLDADSDSRKKLYTRLFRTLLPSWIIQIRGNIMRVKNPSVEI